MNPRSDDLTRPTEAIETRLSEVAAAVGVHVVDLSTDLWEHILDNIPELRADDLVVQLLAASVAENVATLLHLFQHRIPLHTVDAPVAAMEYARRLAQRGIAVIALVRAYRLGHARYLRWCLGELAHQESDILLVEGVTQRILELSFAYIDQVSEQVVTVYQNERDRWLLTQTAVRAGRVAALLDGQSTDMDATESALGYRLRQHHLAVILWVPEPTTSGAGLIRLDRLVAALAAELRCPARPLFVPRDVALAWAWLPLGGRSQISLDHLARIVEETDLTCRIAAGDPAGGIDGFRSSHQQAIGAQTVALAAQPGLRTTTSDDVGPIALMCNNLSATRCWMHGVLGALMTADEPHLRLRDTLRVFLATGGSYAGTAARLTVHKNTVQYRLRKAEEALGHPISQNRSDLELALRACHHLGSAVLTPRPGVE